MVWLADGTAIRADELLPSHTLLGDDGRPVAIVPNTLIGTKWFPMEPQPGLYPTPGRAGEFTVSPGWKHMRIVETDSSTFDRLVVSEDHLLTVVNIEKHQSSSDDSVPLTPSLIDLEARAIQALPSESQAQLRVIKHSTPIEFEPMSTWFHDVLSASMKSCHASLIDRAQLLVPTRAEADEVASSAIETQLKRIVELTAWMIGLYHARTPADVEDGLIVPNERAEEVMQKWSGRTHFKMHDSGSSLFPSSFRSSHILFFSLVCWLLFDSVANGLIFSASPLTVNFSPFSIPLP